MASLEALLKSYSMRKAAVSKARKQIESKLKEAVSKKRRSSSGLAALEKKKEDLTRARDHVSQILNQHLSQKASIERLKIAAEERLKQEQDARDQAAQQSEYGSSTDKGVLAERLHYIDEKIAELHSELKERESAYSRLGKAIESSEKEKARTEDHLKRQAHAKPVLTEQLKSSTKQELMLRPKYESLLKQEAQASRALGMVQKKLAELAALRRKKMAALAAKKRKMAAALAAKRRKSTQMARARKAKAKARRKPAKRKAKTVSGKTKRKATKTSKRKAGKARRKATKSLKRSKKAKPRRR